MRLVGTFRAVAMGLVAAGACDGLAADPVKVGPEIDVSTEYVNFGPRIASDSAGNFMVVWQDDDDTIQARRWHATGNELLPQFQWSAPGHSVQTSGSDSTGNVGVAADAAGNFMMTYTAREVNPSGLPCSFDVCLFTRRNDANRVTGALFAIHDPTTTYVYAAGFEDQVSNPEIAGLANGDFMVVWEGYDLFDTGSSYRNDEGTFGRRTVASGQSKGSYFRVSDGTDQYQGQYGDFSVSGASDGSFVVVFRDEYDYDAPGSVLNVQLYDPKGKRVGAAFGVAADDYEGRQVDIAHAADGTFLVVWFDAYDYNIQGRLIGSDGTPMSGDLLIGADAPDYGPAVAAGDDAFVVVWNGDAPSSPVLGRRVGVDGSFLSGPFEVSPASAGFTPDVAAADNGDFVVAWKAAGYPEVAKAQRFQVETPVEQEIGVFGKALVLSNKVPDDPEKNKVKWKATGPEIVSPPRGTSSDPRCNGDPVGTVKATVQFFSPTSGHDAGVIDLPCENWFALGGLKPGQVSKRSYRYRDSQLDEGPCKSVLVKGEKSITVKCQGKGETTDFPYDLEVGTSEGTVHAVLDMGLYKFCASFPPDGSADGSDGKKFKGKNAAIVGCPP